MGVFYCRKIRAWDMSQNDLKFSIKDTRNETITIEFIQNAPCIILFFNTQCDLCLGEIQLLKEHIRELSNCYNIFFISFEPPRSLMTFFSKQGIDINNKNIHIIADEEMILLDYYKVEGYPSFIILDAKHKIDNRGAAIDNNIISELLKLNF